MEKCPSGGAVHQTVMTRLSSGGAERNGAPKGGGEACVSAA
jgi:hypothetical protein